MGPAAATMYHNDRPSENKKVCTGVPDSDTPRARIPFQDCCPPTTQSHGYSLLGFPPHAFPHGLTTLDTSLPAQCAMATPSLGRAIPRQGGIRPLMCVRQVQPAFEPARVTERRYSFPQESTAETQYLKVRVGDDFQVKRQRGGLFLVWVQFLLVDWFRRPTALGYRVQDRGHVRAGHSKLW